MRYIARTFVLAVMLVLVASFALAQDRTVNLDVKDANVRDVIQTVFKASGQGMVIDPDVQGTITMTLPEMPWEQALSYVLDQAGAQFKKDGAGIYRISNKPAPVEENPQQIPGVRGGVLGGILSPETIRESQTQATKPKVVGTTEEEKIVDKIPMTYAYAGDIALLFGGTIIPLTAPGGGTGGYGSNNGGGYGGNTGYGGNNNSSGYGSGSSGFGSSNSGYGSNRNSGSGYGSNSSRSGSGYGSNSNRNSRSNSGW